MFPPDFERLAFPLVLAGGAAIILSKVMEIVGPFLRDVLMPNW